ncbi:4a-hydroxytetrahydrobiopterin dehydratase [uncultured Nocardioides sp.]|uniref:4a-hydroxytetrahydrobiopterin dehydratase n=1 Tax=uncultured Nocardioides sp. TaxID=198441 RepID=UPI002612E4C5|nr:4a-hydroxytetrahydrobiopterin dehydratase [uncultured Nocardioides sp.]
MSDQTDPQRRLAAHEVAAEGLDDWRLLFDRLHASYDTGDLGAAVALVAEVARAAGAREHHPDLDVRSGRLDVRLTTHDVGGVTSHDVALARRISELARDAGATPRPERTVVLELALDTPDVDGVASFWATLLGYDTAEVEVTGGATELELRDPAARRPSIWFQESEDGEVPSQRWHLDVWLPDEVADDRVAAALEAGGTLVDDTAPGCRVLADHQGNRACVVTWQGRQPPG